jgi:hypothetical protein
MIRVIEIVLEPEKRACPSGHTLQLQSEREREQSVIEVANLDEPKPLAIEPVPVS